MAGKKVNFTKETIESLPLPEKGYTTYRDTGRYAAPGLVIRVYATGVKSFFLSRWIDGKSEYVSIGRFPATLPEPARERAKELNGKIALKENPAEERRNVRAEMTLGELYEKYLDLHALRHKRPKSVDNDERIYRIHLSHWGNRRISTISRQEVRGLLNQIGEKHPHQSNRTRALLHSLYEKAAEWGYTGANPVAKLKKFPEQSRERFILAEELPEFFKAVKSLPSELERDFILLALYSGARKSALLSMAWADIKMDLRLWTIPADKSKNGVSYTIPLVGAALEILERRKDTPADSPWVFPSHSKTGHLQEPKRAWASVVKASGLEGVRLHDVRRTLASWMAITGASEYIIKGALGHKTAGHSVTGIYARLSVEPVREAMDTAVRTMLRKGGLVPEDKNIVEFKASV